MKTHNITNRELFLKQFEPYMSEDDIDNIEDAYQFAKYGHGYKNKKRDEGVRYFEHPRAVAEIIIGEFSIKSDWGVIALALLHDIPEDTWLLSYRVTKKCFGKEFADWLWLLTRNEEHNDEEFKTYITGIELCGEWRVILVKLCDRLHNLRTCCSISESRQRRYLAETEMYFPALITALHLSIPDEMRTVPGKVEALLQNEVTELKTLLKEEKAS